MNPLEKCPACFGLMIEGKDDLGRYRRCPEYYSRKCKFECFERYLDEATDVSYVSFHFDKYFADVYFSAYNHPPNTALIYSEAEMQAEGKCAPIIYVKDFKPDFSNVKALEERISILVAFS